MELVIEPAILGDITALSGLIALSARELGRIDYSPDQIEGALGTAWGVDTQLIRDGTFFKVIADAELVACGGWSMRKTLFGADRAANREPELLDPKCESARIRAFFVHPGWARRGLGRRLLEHCEAAAQQAGFKSTELVATLPGVRLYRACGYLERETIEYELANGTIRFVRMIKPRL